MRTGAHQRQGARRLTLRGNVPTSVSYRAFTLVYVTVIMTALMAFLLFAVDWGRVQVAKMELVTAATSGARAALIDLPRGQTVAINAAIYYSGLNNVDGTSMLVTSSDVSVGTWNATTKVFTAGTTSPNAVCVKGVRSAARGTAVPLIFGNVLGISKCDVTCTVVASNANDVQVNVSSYFNGLAMAPDGQTFASNKGVGNDGYAFSDTLLNGSVTRGGTTYALSRATTNCINCSGQTIPLPAGDYKSVILIAGRAYGPAADTIILHNTDGTLTTYAQTISDWCNVTSSIPNQNICTTLGYRNMASGTRNTLNNYIFSYELPITSSSGVVSITLPVQTNLEILAIGLTPSASITVK